MALRALPSSSSACGWIYDVFLSFRGEDTRLTFTGNLYNALKQRGIHTFFDDAELKRGEEIQPSLGTAIQGSRMAIIVLSQDYASSSFCLDELVTILEHFEGKDESVWPIFYHVAPSEIRYCRGIFKDSLAKHEERSKDDKMKVLKWRFALQKVADFSGDHLKSGHEYEHKFIERIVEQVSRKVNQNPLHVADNLVGLEPQIKEVILRLELELDDTVNMVGIYGTPGIGKSTIARAVYNHIADQFECKCFLDDVRAHGLVQLQETLLCEAVGEKNIKLASVHQGIPIIKRRLQNKKILLVLDNVDNAEQLKNIAGVTDWFGSGSRVIITTRDKGLLERHGVNRFYEVQGLNHEKALELFLQNAFKSHEVDPNFLCLSHDMVRYADGLPLALEVIGSHLIGKGMEEWSSTLERLQRYQYIQHERIHNVLKESYDGLGIREKDIFLDIACCFKGEYLEDIEPMLAACYHSCPINESINTLVEKCLIKTNEQVKMHDLIQGMAKEIVQQESTKDVGQCSRLWSREDIVHVLEQKKGSDKIEIIILDQPYQMHPDNPDKIKVNWDGKALKKMKNLRILIIRNTCFSKRIKYLPKSLKVLKLQECTSSHLGPVLRDLHVQQLVILDLGCTSFQWDKPLRQEFSSLTCMDFTCCGSLQQIPDLHRAPNLKELQLDGCCNLIEIHWSIGFLNKLETLSAAECHKLSIFPPAINLPSLKELILCFCFSLRNFPKILEENENELDIDLADSGIEELPHSIVKLKGLRHINLARCKSLNCVPSDILMLPRLVTFIAENSARFHFFETSEGQEKAVQSTIMPQENRVVNLTWCGLKDEFLSSLCVSSFYHVTHLDLSCNDFKVLPVSFKQCCSLKMLYLIGCEQLQEIEGIPPNILYLLAHGSTSLSSQSSSMLVRQVTTKIGRLFILPRKDVLEQFEFYYACKGVPYKDERLTFWFRKKVPVITLCFVPKHWVNFYFIGQINGSKQFTWEPKDQIEWDGDFLVAKDEPIFYNLDIVELCDEVQLLEAEWNCVKITVKWAREIVVYINKQETSMEDIRFELPLLLPLLKKQRTLLDMEACETSDTQQHQHSTLSDTMTQWGKDLWLNTHNDGDTLNWNSTSNVPVPSSDIVTQQATGHCITDFDGEGMGDSIRETMHSELDLNYPQPMEEDDTGHGITDFDGEGMGDSIRETMHSELDLNYPQPMEEDDTGHSEKEW